MRSAHAGLLLQLHAVRPEFYVHQAHRGYGAGIFPFELALSHGRCGHVPVRLLGVIHIDYKTKKPWPLLRMTLYLPAAYFIFETYGIELTSASESGTIIACIPIFTVLASALLAAGLLGVKLPRSGRGLLALAAGCVVFFALSMSSYSPLRSGCW